MTWLAGLAGDGGKCWRAIVLLFWLLYKSRVDITASAFTRALLARAYRASAHDHPDSDVNIKMPRRQKTDYVLILATTWRCGRSLARIRIDCHGLNTLESYPYRPANHLTVPSSSRNILDLCYSWAKIGQQNKVAKITTATCITKVKKWADVK